MPYLSMMVEELGIDELRETLQAMRQDFPMTRPGDRFYREGYNFIVFELTGHPTGYQREWQDDWERKFFILPNLYEDMKDGCLNCGYP